MHGARKEVTMAMAIIGEYLKPLAEAADESVKDFRGSYRGQDCNCGRHN
jgi:hypothetical protein